MKIFIPSHPCLNWSYRLSSFLSIWWVKHDVLLKFAAVGLKMFLFISCFCELWLHNKPSQSLVAKPIAVYLVYNSLSQQFGLGSTGQFYWSYFHSLMGLWLATAQLSGSGCWKLAGCWLRWGKWGGHVFPLSHQASLGLSQGCCGSVSRKNKTGQAPIPTTFLCLHCIC